MSILLLSQVNPEGAVMLAVHIRGTDVKGRCEVLVKCRASVDRSGVHVYQGKQCHERKPA